MGATQHLPKLPRLGLTYKFGPVAFWQRSVALEAEAGPTTLTIRRRGEAGRDGPHLGQLPDSGDGGHEPTLVGFGQGREISVTEEDQSTQAFRWLEAGAEQSNGSRKASGEVTARIEDGDDIAVVLGFGPLEDDLHLRREEIGERSDRQNAVRGALGLPDPSEVDSAEEGNLHSAGRPAVARHEHRPGIPLVLQHARSRDKWKRRSDRVAIERHIGEEVEVDGSAVTKSKGDRRPSVQDEPEADGGREFGPQATLLVSKDLEPWRERSAQENLQ